MAICEDCGTTVVQRTLKHHTETCPEVLSPCAASKYGCSAKVRRAEITSHEQQCPLVAISPYFEAQNTRINSLELTMRHLNQRNEIFEDGISNIRTTLADSSRIRNGRSEVTSPASADESSDRSNATNYLLAVHESLRDEVQQISLALTDLDARASMSIMNECLRIKEDMAHTNAALNSVRMQVQWLMNPRLHNGAQTRGLRANATSTDNENRSQIAQASGPGPSNATAPFQYFTPSRPRRTSDSGREGTKL